MMVKGFELDRLNLDNGPYQVNDYGFDLPFASNRQRDGGAGFTSHQLDVFIE